MLKVTETHGSVLQELQLYKQNLKNHKQNLHKKFTPTAHTEKSLMQATENM